MRARDGKIHAERVFGVGSFPAHRALPERCHPIGVLKSQIQLTQVLEGMFGRPGDRNRLKMREALVLIFPAAIASHFALSAEQRRPGSRSSTCVRSIDGPLK
jgi:hypothetical protein